MVLGVMAASMAGYVRAPIGAERHAHQRDVHIMAGFAEAGVRGVRDHQFRLA